MNDATPVAATQADKEAAVLEGMKLFERMEKDCDSLRKLWGKGLEHGMMSKLQHDRLVARTMAIKFTILALHCDGTEIAQDNEADVILPAGGGGGR